MPSLDPQYIANEKKHTVSKLQVASPILQTAISHHQIATIHSPSAIPLSTCHLLLATCYLPPSSTSHNFLLATISYLPPFSTRHHPLLCSILCSTLSPARHHPLKLVPGSRLCHPQPSALLIFCFKQQRHQQQQQ